MISNDALAGYIKRTIPDATVSVIDRTGTKDHFIVRVVSEAFKDKSLLDRHRLVYQSLNEPMSDGRIHALEIQAQTHEETSGTAAQGLKIQS
jgi:stress-induced morphogen